MKTLPKPKLQVAQKTITAMKKTFRKVKKIYHLNLRHSYSLVALLTFGSVLFIIYKLSYSNSTPLNKKYKWLESNRNISNFLGREYENHLVKCKYNTEVLIAVISALDHSSQRNAIRESWQRNLPNSWTLLFFTGQTQNGKLKNIVEKERKNLEDLVMLDVEESYLNLTIKVSLVLEWINGQCKQTKFILKMDDDVYVNIPNMKQLADCLTLITENKYSSKTPPNCDQWQRTKVVGHYIDSKSKNYVSYVAGGYVYESIKTDRNVFSKWYTSPTLYSETVLPTFLSGTSYLLTANLIPLILEQVNHTPLINLEDVYITGLIINRALNLKLSHVEGWNHFRPRWDEACFYKTLLTAHGLNPNEISSMTDAVKNVKGCNGIVRQLLSYLNKVISSYIPKYTL